MIKLALYPTNKRFDVDSSTNLLDTLLKNDVPIRSVCRGRGICATCQVSVKSCPNSLTPKTPQEVKTLALIENANEHTRLACQCRVVGEGVVLELPAGLFVENLNELLDLIGEEAVADYRHPINGSLLIPKDKIITRSLLQLFKTLTEEVNNVQN
jgi:ferredoxin